MNSKTTGFWFVIAAALGVAILAVRHVVHPPAGPDSTVLPQLRAADVTKVRILYTNAPEICAVRTNGQWFLTQPLYYPGQSVAIESLLDAIQKLVPSPRITAAEMREHKNVEADFGFVNPPLSLVIEAGDQPWQLAVGYKTAPGDQVYLHVVGIDGASVVNAQWLDFVPRSPDQWRDTSLINVGRNNFDWIVLTNGPKIVELRRNPTNGLWRMLRPLQARADAERIADSLQRLQTARVLQFVTDDPKADLTAYGLQPADTDLWLSGQSNLVTALHIGKSPADDSTLVYARREGWNTVFKVAKDALSPWRMAVNDFRDPYLLGFTPPVAEVEVTGPSTNNNFIVRQQGSNDWTIVGEKFAADTESVQRFIKDLAGLRTSEFVKDVVTAPDLPAYGLDDPSRKIILRSTAGDTNSVIVQLNFGTNQDNKIFVRRSDEDFIYAVTVADFHQRLPEAGWQLRDRHIWNFSPADVAQITIHQHGKTRQIVRSSSGKWSLAPGSTGVIAGANVEQTVERLSQLTAAAWAGRNESAPEWGFAPDNLQVTIELKDGKKFTVDFGLEIRQLQTALAAVTLDGERWTFEFPPVAYQFVLSYLMIPANVP
jgi:Domain of unknown function (DUF4340)